MDFLFVSQPRINGIPAPKEIDCSNPQQDFNIQPLGIAYLAGAVNEEKCSAAIIDASVLNKDYDWIEKKIQEYKPKIVIGCLTAPTWKIDMELAKHAKNNGALFGIWGPLAGALRKVLFSKYPELNFIIENEPEMTMKEIAKNYKKKKNIFQKVKGISYRNKQGKIIWNRYRKLEKNLDSLPMPAFELLDMNLYYTPYNRRRPMTILRTSRGCVAKCIFCITGGQTDIYRGYGAVWRSYSPERVLKEIELVVKKYGIKEINFFDAEFTIDKKRVIGICKGIIDRKIDVLWNCNARADMVNEECLKWMKKAGCYGISYGVESIDEKVTKICKKNINPEQVENAIILTKKAGIQPALYFMIGLPGETIETARKTIDFAKKMAIKYDLRPQCTIATPYPGTVFHEMAEKEKWFKEDIEKLEQTTASICYPNLTQKQLEELHREFYKKVVLNPIRLIKRILRIRHWNEIKSLPIHAREFLRGLLTEMKYLR